MRKNRKTAADIKNSTPETATIKEKVADALDLPAEIMGDIPVVSITGNSDIKVEGYRGIIEYGDNCIRLNTARFMLKINGKGLELKTIATEFIHVKGVISGVEYIM